MREILFRGKCKHNSEWVYGYFVGENSDTPFSPPIKDENIIQEGTGWWVSVEPETVGQYTGLTDKDGNKIFEGDILSIAQKGDSVGRYFDPPIKYPANVVVKWDLCAWMWEVILQEKFYLQFPDAWCHYECEIIGNIYDNPELIGGEKA